MSANDVVTCVSIKKLTDAVEIPQLPIYGAVTIFSNKMQP